MAHMVFGLFTLWLIVLSQMMLPVAATQAQEREAILAADFLVQQCLKEPAAEQDQCLAQLAVSNRDPAICAAVPASKCASLVAQYGIAECASKHEGAVRYQCEIAVVMNYPALDVCDQALDRNTCIMSVAAARKQPNLIAENITDPREMQTYMAAYVSTARDLRGLDYLEDPYVHDMALTYGAAAVGYGADRELGPEYCNRLRGGYTPRPGDLNTKSVAALCNYMAEISDSLLAAEQMTDGMTRSEQRQEEIMAEVLSKIEQLESGTADLSDIVPGLSEEDIMAKDPPPPVAETPPELREGAYGRTPPDVQGLANLVDDSGWQTQSSCKTVDQPPPYYIGISPVDATCPEGWIMRGKGGRGTPNMFRWCAWCGDGFQSRLNRFNCCVREQ